MGEGGERVNEKQKRFVDAYIQTANASEAARQAGYSKQTAYSIGERLLRNVEVKKAIDARLKEMESARVAEAQEVLEHLTAVVRGEMTEEVVTNSGKKFIVTVGERDKLKAAEMLLKVHGAFKDKLDVKVDSSTLFVETLEKIWSKENAGESP